MIESTIRHRIREQEKDMIESTIRHRIREQEELTALNRQGIQQRQGPESPTVTPPGVRVNAGYIKSVKGTSYRRGFIKVSRRGHCIQ